MCTGIGATLERAARDPVAGPVNHDQLRAQERLFLFAQSGSSISTPFLVIVVFWLTVLFVSFGLFAPRNATAIITLLVAAISVAGALFLILDLDRPFSGLMQISSAPLQNALAMIGK
jgi:hypothetical protein